MSRIKILYLDHAPYEAGAEVSLKELVTHLDGERFKRVVAVPLRAPYTAGFRQVGVQHVPFTYHWKSYNLFLPLFWDTLRLATLVRRLKPDIVHTNTRVTNILGGILYRSGFLPRGIKLVNHVRDKDPLPKWKFRLLGACDQIIANSSGVREFLIQGGVPAEKIEVVYNGVDLGCFTPPVKDTKIGSRPRTNFRVTFIGQIYPRKGLKYLLRSLVEVRKRIPGIILQVVGQDPDKRQRNLRSLKKLASRLGISDNIIWFGYQRNIPRILRETDLFVMPSLEEPFGRVIIEAMAMQVPVVATRVGGIPEIVVDGQTGFLVEPRDYQQLAQKIVCLLGNEELARKFGQEGRKRVERCFSLRRHVLLVSSFYDRMLCE